MVAYVQLQIDFRKDDNLKIFVFFSFCFSYFFLMVDEQ